MTVDPIEFAAEAVSQLLIALPDNVHDLNRGLADNRRLIDNIAAKRADLYEPLKAQAVARRALLTAGGHLTPETGSRGNAGVPLYLPYMEQLRMLRGEIDV